MELVGSTDNHQRTIALQEIRHAIEVIDFDGCLPGSTACFKINRDKVLLTQRRLANPARYRPIGRSRTCLDVIHIALVDGDRRVQQPASWHM